MLCDIVYQDLAEPIISSMYGMAVVEHLILRNYLAHGALKILIWRFGASGPSKIGAGRNGASHTILRSPEKITGKMTS